MSFSSIDYPINLSFIHSFINSSILTVFVLFHVIIHSFNNSNIQPFIHPITSPTVFPFFPPTHLIFILSRLPKYPHPPPPYFSPLFPHSNFFLLTVKLSEPIYFFFHVYFNFYLAHEKKVSIFLKRKNLSLVFARGVFVLINRVCVFPHKNSDSILILRICG